MKTKLGFLVLFTAVVSLVIVPPAFTGGSKEPSSGTAEKIKPVILRLATIHGAEDLATQALRKMVTLVEEKTSGSVKLQIFPAAQLGDAISEIEGVSMGSIDMYMDAGAFIAQFVPDKQIESLFFLYDNEKHFRNYLNSDVYKKLNEEFLKKKNIRIIASNWVRGPRSFATTKQLRSIDDLTNVKIRAPEISTYIESEKALGAKPTMVPWGETYLALSQGLVDAVEGAPDILLSANIFEVAKYLMLSEHVRDNAVVAINEKTFNTLSDSQKQALINAAHEAGDWYSQTLVNNMGNVIKKIESLGVKIVKVEDVTPFANKIIAAAEVLEQKGLWRKGLYREIRALK
jgi:tripartite ATP-independent transporter DctP family solute receptor